MKLKTDKYKGINFSTIEHDLIDFDYSVLFDGDVIENDSGYVLIYYSWGYKLLTNDTMEYLPKKEFKNNWKKV